ncbi:glycerophosphocholine cholinephosphodiesterase ENPP6-like [Mercenaria mercenaria]|uniref:glycerophosphocholine cholinephosphodiesterase ENPP6-like n=1 Tax=Mercenaria mercenaria TaxID=6596 RepID=UPI00234F031F|nr:glycerophosphocholine cholinephosphodiesterase ENPP6-like [Mercenaria mercenaria]
MKCNLISYILYFVILQDFKFVNTSKLIVLLVDGFRWDYLDAPDLQLVGFSRLMNTGTRAEWLVPAFPTNSLPNYKSLETGLYVESHGVVGNFIYDSKYGDKLEYMLDNDSKWWTEKDSFFVTAERQGIRTGLFNMGGCYLHFNGVNVTYCLPYQDASTVKESQDATMDAVRRIHNGDIDIAYILHADVDVVGHSSGPGSLQLKQAIKDTDDLIANVLDYLETNKLSDVDMIVVSDHGMASVNETNIIDLNNVLDMDDIDEILESGSVAQIWPKIGRETKIYESLKGFHEHLKVYNRKDILERWFFKQHKFIPPIFVTADSNWCIIHPTSGNHKGTRTIHTFSANHGFDNNDKDMRGVFLASGPDFKQGYTTSPVSIVDVYQLICHVTGIKPMPNNGTWARVESMLKEHHLEL